jgi:2-deoxy-D-gluconate 3-dehydrogenase
MKSRVSLFDLHEKTALVTGCSRGIGQSMALALAEAGADIVGVSATLSPGGPTETAVIQLGRRFTAYAVDFRDRPAVYEFLDQVKATHPIVDILVNNAGLIRREPAAQHSDNIWDEVLEVNLSAPFILTREIGRSMLARGRGKVIFTASLLSFQGGINVPGYAASKGGIAQLTMALSNEWASRGVQVNAIAPGYIATDNTAALRHDPERNRDIIARIPAGRWGNPDDLKGATLFLASSASDYVTGVMLPVDGGWLGR